jgi:dihydroorotate dehydrogenase electron transfer subunit
MMKQELFTILENVPLTGAVYKMRLSGDTGAITRPGQFVNLKLDGFYLRRPISVCDWDERSLTILYKVVGGGTAAMSRLVPGDTLDLLTGLGNGYDLSSAGDRPLLLGGGVGVPPLYRLAKDLLAAGKRVSVVLGFNTADEVFYENEFRALGADVTVTTVDGSCGVKGFVTDALPDDYTYFYTCGPEPMLRAVYRACQTGGQFSFEERMGCGFGACMGCSCKTVTGYKRICKDGPVLRKEEILWDD